MDEKIGRVSLVWTAHHFQQPWRRFYFFGMMPDSMMELLQRHVTRVRICNSDYAPPNQTAVCARPAIPADAEFLHVKSPSFFGAITAMTSLRNNAQKTWQNFIDRFHADSVS